MPISWGDVDWRNLGREDYWMWVDGLHSWVKQDEFMDLRPGRVIWIPSALWFWEV